MSYTVKLLAAASACAIATPAAAQSVALGEGASLDLTGNVRLRYETVSQDNASGDADALTVRARLGAEAKASGFSLLVEGEATGALADDYNDTLPGNGIEPFSVVADPENIELNRAQISYLSGGNGATLGRQRIILDNARFVGNVGWRQNEQTFDAVRGQARIGPVSANAIYAISQRTIFGSDSPNEHFDGDLILLNAAVDLAVVDASAFAYLIDYDTRVAFSSATYGVLAKAAIPVPGFALNATASFATQSDMGANPVEYTAQYWNFELGGSVAGIGLTAGYEKLGSDGGVAAFQTPLATLHAFNGWADLFLTTPANGIQDYYVKASVGIPVPGVATFNATVVYHEFDSDFGDLSYGSEWDASLGFKIGPVGLLAKYANFDSSGFAVDTEKFWLQAEISF